MRKPALFALLFPLTVGFVFRTIGSHDGRYLLGIEVFLLFVLPGFVFHRQLWLF
jgi:hypothetical protein